MSKGDNPTGPGPDKDHPKPLRSFLGGMSFAEVLANEGAILGEGKDVGPGAVYQDGPPVPALAGRVEVENYEVCCWSSQEADAPEWKPEHVHFRLHVGLPVPIVMRLKSRDASRLLIEALIRSHRDCFDPAAEDRFDRPL